MRTSPLLLGAYGSLLQAALLWAWLSLAATRTGVEQVSCQLHRTAEVAQPTHLSRVVTTTLVRAFLKLEKGAKPARSGPGKACLVK